MQWRHKEKQRLLIQLEEAAKLCRTEHAAQKARREVEEKAQEEAERQRVVEEEEKKKEDSGVLPTALGRGVRGRGCPIGEG